MYILLLIILNKKLCFFYTLFIFAIGCLFDSNFSVRRRASYYMEGCVIYPEGTLLRDGTVIGAGAAGVGH